MKTSSVIHCPGFLAGTLLVLLASTVSTPSLSQATSWPDPAGIRELKQQLAESEAKKGQDNPDLVEVLLKLGNAYRDEGGYVLAAPYVERALSIIEKTRGSKHLEVGATLDKLGTLYLAQGDTARARAAYLRAKPILLRELRRNKPGYGIFLLHLAELQLLTGRTREAQATVDQALTAFGGELSQAAHDWTEVNRRLGLLLLGLGKYQEAELELVYALTVRSEAMSFANRDEALFYMASANNSLGEFYVTVGRDDEAEPLLLDALMAYEKKYGKDHPLLEGVLINLAALYGSKGDGSSGRQYVERVQDIHRRSAGYSHMPDSPVRTLVRVTPPPRPLPTRADDAPEIRLGAVTGAAAVTAKPILLRLNAPVGRVTRYHTQTRSWGLGDSTDPNLPDLVMTDSTTETITAVKGDVRTISAVVVSSQLDTAAELQQRAAKNVWKGQTTLRRMDSRGRVLLSKVTREAKGMQGRGVASHAGGAFTLPEGPVRIGDKWTATERMSLGPGSGGLYADVEVAYRLERVGLKGGARVAVISMNGVIVVWSHSVGLKGDRAATPNATPELSSMSGELHIDLDAGWMVGLTVNIENQWGTPQGRKTRLTRTAP